MAGALSGADLATLAVLEGADEGDLDRVALMLTVVHAKSGEVIGREDEPGGTFWLVLSGQVEISRTTRHGTQVLAVAGPGSILGELAVLRGLPRTATVTAVNPSDLAVGDADALERLLAMEVVCGRVRRLASERLAHDLRPVRVALPDGTPTLVRPLLPEDREAFDSEVHKLSRESLRRRFFSSAGPSPSLVDYLIDIDYVDHFAWVVIDEQQREGVATARYVRGENRGQAEMAFTTVDRFQGRGAGTFLLGALGVAAAEAGVSVLVAHVMEDNRAMRAVFAKTHPKTRFDEPGVVLVEVDPEAAASLIDAEVRRRLADAVHDIVTAATLALTRPRGVRPSQSPDLPLTS